MSPNSQLELTSLGRIGGIVHGIKLGADLTTDCTRAINEALVRHKVLFFREQHHLDDGQQYAFALHLGRPFVNPAENDNHLDTRLITEVDSTKGEFGNSWHADLTFLPAYPKGAVLRALTIPPSGGSTIWANTAAAYQNLPAALKALADTLRAVHTNGRRTVAINPIRTEHPVVRVHPETQEKCLLIGRHIHSIEGLPEEDGRVLIDLFARYIRRPENSVRWYWQVGDLAVWDNRATEHYAVHDYGNQPRLMHRIALDGELPRGVDGTPSRALAPTQNPQANSQ